MKGPALQTSSRPPSLNKKSAIPLQSIRSYWAFILMFSMSQTMLSSKPAKIPSSPGDISVIISINAFGFRICRYLPYRFIMELTRNEKFGTFLDP